MDVALRDSVSKGISQVVVRISPLRGLLGPIVTLLTKALEPVSRRTLNPKP